MRWAVLVAVAGIALWLATRNGCRHVDEDGRSLLVWTRREGRIKGWCPQCFALTPGWEWPDRPPRPPRARPATPAEIAQLETQRQARFRLQRRLRRRAA